MGAAGAQFKELNGGGRITAVVAGLLLGILGAAGMGCAGFLAEQHALISYNIVPGAAPGMCQAGVRNWITHIFMYVLVLWTRI